MPAKKEAKDPDKELRTVDQTKNQANKGKDPKAKEKADPSKVKGGCCEPECGPSTCGT